jgi:hypothetical protein
MTKWEEWKKSLGETRPWHLLDHNRLIEKEAVVESRLEICKACPEFLKPTSQCKKCGCFMPLKTKLAEAVCPINKWGREE